MEHIRDIDILDQISGKLDSQQARQIKDHIAGCDKCSRKYNEMLRTWDVLGEWEIKSAEVDIAEAIVSKAQSLKNSPNYKLLSILSDRQMVSVAFRVAASIIIAVSIGAVSGVRTAQNELSSNSTVTEEPYYLAALGLQWSNDLNWSVLEEYGPDSEAE